MQSAPARKSTPSDKIREVFLNSIRALTEALEAKGRDVAVAWREDQTFEIDERPAAGAPSTEQETKRKEGP